MYPNLRAEMARQNISANEIGRLLGKTASAVRAKLNGKSSITIEEAKKIKSYLKTDVLMETLFSKEAK